MDIKDEDAGEEFSASPTSDSTAAKGTISPPKTPDPKTAMRDQVISGRVTKSRASPIKRVKKDHKSLTDPYKNLDAYNSDGEKLFATNDSSSEATAIGDGEYTKDAAMPVKMERVMEGVVEA